MVFFFRNFSSVPHMCPAKDDEEDCVFVTGRGEKTPSVPLNSIIFSEIRVNPCRWEIGRRLHPQNAVFTSNNYNSFLNFHPHLLTRLIQCWPEPPIFTDGVCGTDSDYIIFVMCLVLWPSYNKSTVTLEFTLFNADTATGSLIKLYIPHCKVSFSRRGWPRPVLARKMGFLINWHARWNAIQM